MSTNDKKSSISLRWAPTIIAIISILITSYLTYTQIDQSTIQFAETLKRDSVLNESETELVNKQLELVRIQNTILDKTFKNDSILQSEKLNLLEKNTI